MDKLISKIIDGLVDEGVDMVKSGSTLKAAIENLLGRINCPAGATFGVFKGRIQRKIADSKRKGYKFSKAKNEKPIEPEPFVFSAVNAEGKLMGIDEYCEVYNLPRHDVKGHKLITHTGTPFYNTLFRDVATVAGILSKSDLSEIISHHSTFISLPSPITIGKTDIFDRLVYTDTHIGMDTDKDNVAMYATPWNKNIQLSRAALMAGNMIANKKGSVLYVDDLADFMDGWNGFTTRGGHPLPQNMSNKEAFETGLAFKMLIADCLIPHYDKVIFNNICNDNHAGEFGYILNVAFKQLCEAKYGTDRVEVKNHPQFINYYVVGKHAFVITHGKDSKALKFGFKPQLDAKQIEKIDAFLKYNKIYSQAEFIEFAKGDSHQALFDYCTSDDFDYFNYPAFSPASEWVQTNFKKSRSGFVIQHVMYDQKIKQVTPFWF